MTRPNKEPGSEVGIAVTTNGITAYCNRRALRSLARQLRWMAAADPSEHYEVHLVWHMSNHWGKTPGVFVLLDETLRRVYPSRGAVDPGFELTIMAIPDNDLRRMRPRRGRRGSLRTIEAEAIPITASHNNQMQRTRSAPRSSQRRGPRR